MKNGKFALALAASNSSKGPSFLDLLSISRSPHWTGCTSDVRVTLSARIVSCFQNVLSQSVVNVFLLDSCKLLVAFSSWLWMSGRHISETQNWYMNNGWGEIKDRMPSDTWPAISDIWLGIRTVPVLSVATESRGASQIAHSGRGAPEHRQVDADWLIDDRVSRNFWVFVRLLMFLSLLEEITGHGMPVECSKLTCFAKVKIRHGSRAVRLTIEVGRCQSSFAYCEAEFDLGKGKNRSEATYPHWKDENNNQPNPNSHVYESESQSEVDVRWPAMYA